MKSNVEELVQERLLSALTYESYRNLVHELASQGKSTASKETEAYVQYTKLNDQRMRRFDKTVKLDEQSKAAIGAIKRKLTFLVLTESWCGDAAPTLPVMNKIAEVNSNIGLKILFRDQNLDLMHHFLTDGTLSIPKLLIIDDASGTILGDWGPRPSVATEMVKEFKANFGPLTPEFKQDLQVWYNKDKGITTLRDILLQLPLE